ncbi:hypothetical protein VTP01DRAFT_8237 [Rhizomucor pusillus]|uniref:uncharacterized protein n=1 Tax=Rhizomucor pusillus TaxID=4840 RepID=UPI0037432C5C
MPSVVTPLERIARIAESPLSFSNGEKIDALRALSVSLSDNVAAEQAEAIFETVPLRAFYQMFAAAGDDSEEEQYLVKILCEVVGKLLQPIGYQELVGDQSNATFLLQGLGHFSPSIRLLSLIQVEKCLESDEATEQVAHSNVFPMIITTIAFQDTGIASKAVDLTSKIGSKVPNALFEENVNALQSLLSVNETVRFRVYELVVNVSGSSDRAFDLGKTSGLLQTLIDEVRSPDLLLRLNAIEILGEVAVSSSGFAFLEKAEVLDSLTELMDNEDESDTGVVLTKSLAFKFFGKLGGNKDIIFEPIERKYHVFSRLHRCLDTSTNREILTVAIAAIGLIGSHPSNLQLLFRSSLKDYFVDSYRTSSGHIKAVYLQSLSKILSVRDGPETEQMTEDIYRSLEGRPSTLESLVQTAKQPVPEVRMAAFATLHAIATHTWGQQIMANSGDFLGYLLDRTTEHSLPGQQWKYAIVEALIRADNAVNIFGGHYPMLQRYLREGPYYRPTEPVTAMESA